MEEVLHFGAWREALAGSLASMSESVAEFLPRLLAAIVILAIGWAVSKLFEVVASRLLRRLGLDRAAQRLRVADALREGGVQAPPSEAAGRLIFWLAQVGFLLIAIQTLGLTVANGAIERIATYLPNLVAGILMLAVGVPLARLVRNLVATAAAAASVEYATRLAVVSQTLVLVLAAVLALEQVGIETTFLVAIATALFATVGVTLGIAFALGASRVITHILAGHYLRQSLPAGRIAEVEGQRGMVESVGPVATVFRNDDRTWSVPNARLLDEIVSH